VWAPFLRPFALRWALGALGPRLSPFDLEAFLRVHFEKVGAQTRLMFRGYLDEGARRGLPTEALGALARRLEPSR
jgi:2-dehydropantoate 2-reductase